MNSGIRSKHHPNITTATCIPFPVLKTLRLKSLYPFTDDIIFRGNSATLEYLEFLIDKDTVNMLNSARVFENKHKVLRNLIVAKISDNDNNPLGLGTELEHIDTDILPDYIVATYGGVG
ncbi:hypothetical protein H4S03_000974, partial [Coemansia sp. S3946]